MKNQTRYSWKAEWKAAGLDPGPLSEDEEAQVPRLVAENREFLEKHPPETVLKKARPRPRTLPFQVWSVPLAAAAALLVFLGLPGTPAPKPGTGLERMKGNSETAVVVYRQGAKGPEKLAPRTLVHAGDVLQVAYHVSKPQQGALLSLDGEGNVMVHLAKDGRSVALVPGAEHPLEFGYELDRAPRYEVFFLVTSDTPFDLEPIRRTLKAASTWESLTDASFGSGLHVAVLPLAKETLP